MKKVIGVISDTHGLLRPEAIEAFHNVSLILHAGDIGRPEVLDELRRVAPVIAVRGNNDQGGWAAQIPETQLIREAAVSLFVLHDVKELQLDPRAQNIQAVISGHSHRPSVIQRDGVLFLNPGSAGPRRFKLPISVAKLIVQGSVLRAEIIEL